MPAIRSLLCLGLMALHVCTCSTASTAPRSGPAPTEASESPASAAFTARMAVMVGRLLPEISVQPSGALAIEGRRSDGSSTGRLTLERVYGFCQEDSERCTEVMNRFAQVAADRVRELAQPVEPAMVRLVVREQAFLDRLRAEPETAATPFFSHPFTPGLAIVAVLDYPTSIRFADASDLAALKLSEAELFDLGERNLRRTLQPLSQVLQIPAASTPAHLSGDDYISSQLLFHSAWKDLAVQMKQQLVVMVPAPDTVLYGDGSTAQGLQAMRERGIEAARQTSRPLSTQVLRWTEAGWEAVPY